MGRIGYNINAMGIRDIGALEQHLIKLQPTMIVVMDGIQLADRLYHLLGRKCLVIHRDYSSLEGSEWRERSPEDFVNTWVRQGYPHIMRYTTNEPDLSDLPAFIAHQVKTLELASAAGLRVSAGQFAVGTWHEDDVVAGRYDDLLYTLALHPEHNLGVHEYGAGVLPMCFPKTADEVPTPLPDSLFNKQVAQPHRWITRQQLDLIQANDGITPFYFLRRSDWFIHRAKILKIHTPNIAITEGLWDDIVQNWSHAKERFQEWAEAPYSIPRGVFGYRRYFNHMLPQWSFARAVVEQLKWALSIYPDKYIGIALFAWNTGWDFDINTGIGIGMDFSIDSQDAIELRRLMEHELIETQSNWQEARIRGNAVKVNVRDQAGGRIVGTITNQLADGQVQMQFENDGAFWWHKIRIGNLVGVVREDVVTIELGNSAPSAKEVAKSAIEAAQASLTKALEALNQLPS